MGCAIGCLALAFPRVALVLVWLILGFLFLPLTTLAFAFASNSIGPMHDVTPFGWLLVILALLVDLGLLGGGGRAARRRREDAD